MMGWLLVAGLATALRIAISPPGSAGVATLAPYFLLVLVPFASMVLALRWFADGDRLSQPKVRLARVGSWQSIGRSASKRHPLYGTSGMMVSLLVGMLLNVPIRAIEYLGSLPALTGTVPAWLSTLHLAMTFDVLLLTGLYTVAFVAALRRVPAFPRLLAGIWLLDLTMQLVIASSVAAAPDLPADVALAVQNLLGGNVNKVLISAALWLPYLLLSKRVNVTFRHRIVA